MFQGKFQGPFDYASSFNQPLSFDTSSVTIMRNVFNPSGYAI